MNQNKKLNSEECFKSCNKCKIDNNFEVLLSKKKAKTKPSKECFSCAKCKGNNKNFNILLKKPNIQSVTPIQITEQQNTKFVDVVEKDMFEMQSSKVCARDNASHQFGISSRMILNNNKPNTLTLLKNSLEMSGTNKNLIFASHIITQNMSLIDIQYLHNFPKIFHYIWIPELSYGSKKGLQAAMEWEKHAQMNGSIVIFWTEHDILSLLNSSEKTIYSYYCSALQKLHFASYTLLYHYGGVFVHPSYMPKSTFWDAIYMNCTSNIDIILCERSRESTCNSSCRWWNGIIIAKPQSFILQHIKNILIPRYLTPIRSKRDIEWSTGCFLLEQINSFSTLWGQIPKIYSISFEQMKKFCLLPKIN